MALDHELARLDAALYSNLIHTLRMDDVPQLQSLPELFPLGLRVQVRLLAVCFLHACSTFTKSENVH